MKKSADGWKELDPDFTIVTTQLVAALTKLDVSKADIRTIFIDNPKRVLAF